MKEIFIKENTSQTMNKATKLPNPANQLIAQCLGISLSTKNNQGSVPGCRYGDGLG